MPASNSRSRCPPASSSTTPRPPFPATAGAPTITGAPADAGRPAARICTTVPDSPPSHRRTVPARLPRADLAAETVPVARIRALLGTRPHGMPAWGPCPVLCTVLATARPTPAPLEDVPGAKPRLAEIRSAPLISSDLMLVVFARLKSLQIHSVILHPGASIEHQITGLKSCEPEFLIATPERLLELVSAKAIDISNVSMLKKIVLVEDGCNDQARSSERHIRAVQIYSL